MTVTFHLNIGMSYRRPSTSEVLTVNNEGRYVSGKEKYMKSAAIVMSHLRKNNILPTCAIVVYVNDHNIKGVIKAVGLNNTIVASKFRDKTAELDVAYVYY